MNLFFIQGFQHPFLTPSHIIILVGIGILIGQQAGAQGLKQSFSAIALFVLSATIGAWMHRFYPITLNIEQTLLIIAAMSGILIAVRLQLAIFISLLLVIFCGVLIGQDSAPVVIPGIKMIKVYTSLAGSVISASLFLGVIAIVATLLRKLLQGIPLRILGAWIFASAIMVLALQFSPLQP